MRENMISNIIFDQGYSASQTISISIGIPSEVGECLLSALLPAQTSTSTQPFKERVLTMDAMAN